MNIEQTPKIMITGTHGFVGARAMEKYPFAIAVPSELVRNADDALFDFVCQHRPQIIINAAAISDIKECEKNPKASWNANVILPEVLAKASNTIDAKLISFSSDQVYTGCEDFGPYSEDWNLPEPANLYAKHKLEAEKRCLPFNRKRFYCVLHGCMICRFTDIIIEEIFW